ncbi:MAG: dockerin type I domain-containing protein [Bacteroidetes bacterium]|nr:dockerin type I domain-containing protein [Bacteroidota bacterium]
MKKIVFLLLGNLFLIGNLPAQDIQIGNLLNCFSSAGDTVWVPVIARDLENIGAISLYIAYPSVDLTYVCVADVDPILTTLGLAGYNGMTSPVNMVAFQWFKTSLTQTVNLPNDTLFRMQFVYHCTSADSSLLAFYSLLPWLCEVYNDSCNIYSPAITYIDGSLAPGTIATASTVNQTLCAGMTVNLVGNASGGSGSVYSYAWSGPNGFYSILQNPSISNAQPNQTGSYCLTVADVSGCFSLPSCVTITVNPSPIVTLGNFPIVCSESSVYTLSGGSPAGGTYSGNAFVSNGIFNPQAAGTGTHTIKYSYTEANGCSDSVTKTIQVGQFPKITGTVSYDNLVGTPLGNIWVTRKDSNNIVIDSVITGSGTGNYSFTCLTGGTYQLAASTGILPGFGIVNTTDALLAMKAFAGLITLSPLRQKAADVNGSGNINGTDALMILEKFTGMISSFPAPAWQFETIPEAVVNNNVVTRSFKAICTGDVNGSYLP